MTGRRGDIIRISEEKSFLESRKITLQEEEKYLEEEKAGLEAEKRDLQKENRDLQEKSQNLKLNELIYGITATLSSFIEGIYLVKYARAKKFKKLSK